MFIKSQFGYKIYNFAKFCSVKCGLVAGTSIEGNIFDVYLVFDYNVEPDDFYQNAAHISLGIYKTEARAEEVINEIYRALTRGENTYTMPEK